MVRTWRSWILALAAFLMLHPAAIYARGGGGHGGHGHGHPAGSKGGLGKGGGKRR